MRTSPYGISRVAAGEAKDGSGAKIFYLFSIKPQIGIVYNTVLGMKA